MQKITPFLWFNNQAEEAARFYTSIFKNSRITDVVRYTDSGPAPAGTVMTVTFELDGQQFTALNGGPEFNFTEAISFAVDCETQEEVDRLWNALTEGGEPGMCGWLKDKYGVSWQVVPTVLYKMLHDPDPAKTKRVTEAVFQMKKLHIPTLQAAYEGA
ncbi:MAG: VOC family protein [Chloroflexi bacterium]|nr:VOC family protein [Chloroflexota bacterium]